MLNMAVRKETARLAKVEVTKSILVHVSEVLKRHQELRFINKNTWNNTAV